MISHPLKIAPFPARHIERLISDVVVSLLWSVGHGGGVAELDGFDLTHY